MPRLIYNQLAVHETEGVHCPSPIRTLIEPEVDLALNCGESSTSRSLCHLAVQSNSGVVLGGRIEHTS